MSWGPSSARRTRSSSTSTRNPDSQITVKMIDGEDGQVDKGETDLEPEVVMTMEADTAHKFWLGKVNVTVALARGQMKAKGPVAKILKLVPLVKPVFPRYREMLERRAAPTWWRPEADGSGLGARRPPDGGLQGLLPGRPGHPGDRRAGTCCRAPASSSPRRAPTASSWSPTR